MANVRVADEKTNLKRGVDYIGVTVSFIIHDGQGKILLQKRSKNCRDEQGRWDIGGGALEFGEQLDDAVRREVKEELKVEPLEMEFIKPGEAHRQNNNKPTHWIWFLYAVKVDPEKVAIGEPHKIDAIGWFGADDLPEPLHSMFPKAHTEALKRGILK